MISLWMVGKSCATKLGCFFNISHGMFTINWCRISLAHPQSLSLYTYIYILYHYISYSHDIPHYSYIIHPWYLFHGDITISGGNHWVPATVSLHELIAHGSHQLSATGVLAPRHGSNDLSIYLSLYIYICICIYVHICYIYMYTCMYISIFRIYRLDDVYVRNNSLGGEMHGIPCGTAICWVVSVRVFRTLRACKIWFLPASHCIFALTPKLHFEAYLKDILCNLQCFEPLTETSTSRKTLQEPQTNLTLNN